MVIQGGKGHRVVWKLILLVGGRRSFQDVPPDTSGSCWSTGRDWYNHDI